MGHFLIFLDSFFVFFMFTIFGIANIERIKNKEESSQRPATRIFVECFDCRECDCRCSPVPRGCVASRACTSVWLGTGFFRGWVESKRAAVLCRCG